MNKKLAIELGEILQKARVAKSLTQLQLSQHLGYSSTQFVSLFERGISKVPLDTLNQLCELLSISKPKIKKMLVASYEAELAEIFVEVKK